MTMSNAVNRVLDELDTAMHRLREAMRGIPVRYGSFKRTHENLARDVAQVTTMLDAARPVMDGKDRKP